MAPQLDTVIHTVLKIFFLIFCSLSNFDLKKNYIKMLFVVNQLYFSNFFKMLFVLITELFGTLLNFVPAESTSRRCYVQCIPFSAPSGDSNIS